MDLAALRTQQQSLAASVERADRLDRDPPVLIGGADVGFEQEGEITRAAMVLLTYPGLELVEYQVARVATTMPYIPGFLSFRETPLNLIVTPFTEAPKLYPEIVTSLKAYPSIGEKPVTRRLVRMKKTARLWRSV